MVRVQAILEIIRKTCEMYCYYNNNVLHIYYTMARKIKRNPENRVVGYLRVSTDEQSLGAEDQRIKLQEHRLWLLMERQTAIHPNPSLCGA